MSGVRIPPAAPFDLLQVWREVPNPRLLSPRVDRPCLRTVVHFAVETAYFAIQVRTFRSQLSALPRRNSNGETSLSCRRAARAYAALRFVPSLFKTFEKFLEIDLFRLRVNSHMAPVKALDTFNPTRELP